MVFELRRQLRRAELPAKLAQLIRGDLAGIRAQQLAHISQVFLSAVLVSSRMEFQSDQMRKRWHAEFDA